MGPWGTSMLHVRSDSCQTLRFIAAGSRGAGPGSRDGPCEGAAQDITERAWCRAYC